MVVLMVHGDDSSKMMIMVEEVIVEKVMVT
jgi:hypothetical protein